MLPMPTGLVQGEDEDDALARGLGVASAGALSDVQRKYAERVKAKLAEVCLFHLLALRTKNSRCRGAEQAPLLPQQMAAAAQAEAARQRLFTAGKRAYEYGQVTRLSL